MGLIMELVLKSQTHINFEVTPQLICSLAFYYDVNVKSEVYYVDRILMIYSVSVTAISFWKSFV